MSTQPTTTPATQNNAAVDTVTAIRQGQPPSNQQLDAVVNKAQDTIAAQSANPNLSADAQKAVADLNPILNSVQQLNQNKNPDEKLQNVISSTASAGQTIGQQGQQHLQGQDVGAQGQQIKDTTKQAGQSALSVGKLMVTNGQFRKELSNFVNIFQEIFLTDDEGSAQQGQQTQQKDASSSSDTSDSTWSQFKNANFASKPLTDEQKHKLSGSFLTVLRQFNQNPQFNGAIKDLFSTLSTMRNDPQNKNAFRQLQDTAKSHPDAVSAGTDTQVLLERLSGRPVEPLLTKLTGFFDFLRNHEVPRNWFNDFTQLVDDGLNKPQELDEKEFTGRVEKLIDQGRQLSNDPEFRVKYSDLMQENKLFFKGIASDPDLQNVSASMKNFLDNFTTTDQNGNVVLKTDLLSEMRQILVPLFISQLDNVPIPPIDGSNDDYDYHFDNIIFNAEQVLPDKIQFNTSGNTELDSRTLSTTKSGRSAELLLTNIKPKLDKIHFQFHRKTFPKLSDDGIANAAMSGDGLNLRILMAPSLDQNNVPQFNISDVNATVDKLDLKIVECKHDFLIPMFASLYEKKVRTMIASNIEQKVRQAFEQIQQTLNQVFSKYLQNLPSKGDVVQKVAGQVIPGLGAPSSSSSTPASTGTTTATTVPAATTTTTVPVATTTTTTAQTVPAVVPSTTQV